MLRGMDLMFSMESFQALEEVRAKVWFRKILLPELRETQGGEVAQECVMGVCTSAVWTSGRRDGWKGMGGRGIRNRVTARESVPDGLWERAVGIEDKSPSS